MMQRIDSYAYSNRLRKLDPAYKAGFSSLVLLACLFIDRPLILLLILLGLVALSILGAGLPPAFVLKLLTAEGGFLAAGVLSVAISISTIPQPGGWQLGLVWIHLSPASLNLALVLLGRALAGAAAMNFLALTTPLADLIELLRRLRTPELLIDLMTLIYRFVFTLTDCLDRMILAQKVRLGFGNWRNSLQSAAQIAANLFIETFRRSRQLELALGSRGWTDNLRVLPQEYQDWTSLFK